MVVSVSASASLFTERNQVDRTLDCFDRAGGGRKIRIANVTSLKLEVYVQVYVYIRDSCP